MNGNRRGEVQDGGRRRSDRLGVILICLALVAMLVSAVLSVSVLRQQGQVKTNTRSLEKNANRLDAALRGGCQRLQRLRDDLNLSNDGQYRVIVLAAKSVPAGRFRKLYREVAAETFYSPPTDCTKATSHPRNFPAPASVPFSWVACRFRPPFLSRVPGAPPANIRPTPLPQCKDPLRP